MKRILIAVGLVAVLAGCSRMVETSPKTVDPEKIMYVHDPRTDLCFSFITVHKMTGNGDNSYSISHANVPCTDKVKALLAK